MPTTTISAGAGTGPRIENSHGNPRFFSSSSPRGDKETTTPATAVTKPVVHAINQRRIEPYRPLWLLRTAQLQTVL
jgi:hypothetical protein